MPVAHSPAPVPSADLWEFVLAYETARNLIADLDDLRRIARELVQDAAHAGVVWTEIHLIPPTYAGRLGPDEGVLEAVLDGVPGRAYKGRRRRGDRRHEPRPATGRRRTVAALAIA